MSAQEKLRNCLPVAIGLLGDSCGCGFGANPMLSTWNDGNSYGYMNLPDWGYNWTVGNPHSLTTSGLISQACQDNKQIPSAARLLRTYLESRNPGSKLYNFSASGWTASDHVNNSSIAALASKPIKPDAVIIALGINDAKHGKLQPALETLIKQCIASGIQPVISLGHYPASTPFYRSPSLWNPMSFWQNMRAEMLGYAEKYNLTVIDPTSGYDMTLLYDEPHPSAKGHKKIFEAYYNWINQAVMISGQRFSHSPYGAVKIGNARLNISDNGVVRINTTLGVKPLA